MSGFEKFGRTGDFAPLALQAWKVHQKKLTEEIFPAVSERIKNVKSRDSTYFEAGKRMITANAFPPGSRAMMRDITKESKWYAEYEGPFHVVRRNCGGAFVLRD